MKRATAFLFAVVLLIGLGVTALAANTVRSGQTLNVNGERALCDVYNIDGSNYFKLRDLAYLLKGTEGCFEVTYDSETNRVLVSIGKTYTANGSELVIGKDLSASAVVSAQTIYIDGVRRDDLSVYNIGGNNYFKLRDLGAAIGFDVEYDEVTRTMLVQTGKEDKKPEKSSFSVQFIDCGQGDAALIECDGHFMLIDGGDRTNSQRMYSVLKERNITHLDLLAATHPHEDHIGGIPGALSYANAAKTLCNVYEDESSVFATFKKYAEQKGGGITVPKAGDMYALGSARVYILGVNAGESENDHSIIVEIVYGKTSFLFMADAETSAEETLLHSGAALRATVLKVGHHGSASSSSTAFLDAVSPEYAVISVGRNNSYAHPAQTTLNNLHTRNAEILRTDLHGDISFASNGESVSVITAHEADESRVLKGGSSGVAGEGETGGAVSAADYIANLNSGIFHLPNCRSVSAMSEKNKLYFSGTSEELIRMGYKPCGICNP